MCRHLGNDALVQHYESYLAHSAEPDVTALAEVDGESGDARQDAMARHADYLIDPHSSAARRDPAYRRRLIAALAPCAYGTVGGPFVEPPQHWEHTRWFLPCLERAARHVKHLHAEGGRAMEVFFHILANPGDEVTVRHTAALLRDPARSHDEVYAYETRPNCRLWL